MTEAPGAESTQAVQVGRTDGKLRTKTVAAALVALPAVLFYAVLFRQSINLPDEDDYDAILAFLNKLAQLQSFPAKITFYLTTQHNEYKIFFEHGLVWALAAVFGHVDFRLLCAIGNGFVLLLGILLWKMFLPEHKDTFTRLMLFVPASWILFQLQYVELMDWAMPSLQHLPSLFFSLSAIYLLVRTTAWSYYGATACLILGIASSGNALLLVPIGALILLRRRSYARMTGWLVVSAVCIAAYAYHYSFTPDQNSHHSIFWKMAHARPTGMLVFIGNAIAVPRRWDFFLWSVRLSAVAGLVLCIFFAFLTWKGYFRRNPTVGYCVLFLLLTAVGVAGIRTGGARQEAMSRYGIHSALFLIFAWFAVVEEFRLHAGNRLRGWLLAGAVAVAMLFSVGMDVMGWRYLVARNRELISGMTAFERTASSETRVGPVLPVPNQPAWLEELEGRAAQILTESIRLGIYTPPQV
jgi:hypothetical protein